MSTSFYGGAFFGGEFYSSSSGSVAQPSGGYYEHAGNVHLLHEGRHESRRRLREEYGILPKAAEVIEQVAQRQASETAENRLDDDKRVQELVRELDAASVEWKSQYLAALNAERDRLITAEIARIQSEQLEADNERIMMLMMLM